MSEDLRKPAPSGGGAATPPEQPGSLPVGWKNPVTPAKVRWAMRPLSADGGRVSNARKRLLRLALEVLGSALATDDAGIATAAAFRMLLAENDANKIKGASEKNLAVAAKSSLISEYESEEQGKNEPKQ